MKNIKNTIDFVLTLAGSIILNAIAIALLVVPFYFFVLQNLSCE